MNPVFRLKKYTDALKSAGLYLNGPSWLDEKEVTGLTFDSRKAAEGTLFVCKGAAFKEEYLRKAFEQGAFCYVSDKRYGAFPGIIVSDIRSAMAVLANVFDDNAWEAFPLVGITGTKGKSTVTYYIKSIAEKRAEKTGAAPLAYLSTIDTFDGIESFESHLTTPEAIELGERFSNARDAGVSAMIMEVSSQALKYQRTEGVVFDIGAFLNFGTDHIGGSEHPDEEDYLNSKLKIFAQSRTVIVNLGTDRKETILAAAKASAAEKIICYSANGCESAEGLYADYLARDVRKEQGNTVFGLYGRNEDGEYRLLADITLTMPGLFNVENAAAAAAICFELGYTADEIREGLLNARAAGRMEHFRSDEKDLDVIVDYAHNEMSFRSLFSSIKEEYPGRRLEAVFGCPGGKGLQRREALPKAAADYCDFVWVTEEDPGFEDPEEISAQVLANLERFGGKGRIIVDREECIRTAIEGAAPGTVLVLAAKGRENYMKRGAKYVPMISDAELAEKYL